MIAILTLRATEAKELELTPPTPVRCRVVKGHVGWNPGNGLRGPRGGGSGYSTSRIRGSKSVQAESGVRPSPNPDGGAGRIHEEKVRRGGLNFVILACPSYAILVCDHPTPVNKILDK